MTELLTLLLSWPFRLLTFLSFPALLLLLIASVKQRARASRLVRVGIVGFGLLLANRVATGSTGDDIPQNYQLEADVMNEGTRRELACPEWSHLAWVETDGSTQVFDCSFTVFGWPSLRLEISPAPDNCYYIPRWATAGASTYCPDQDRS